MGELRGTDNINVRYGSLLASRMTKEALIRGLTAVQGKGINKTLLAKLPQPKDFSERDITVRSAMELYSDKLLLHVQGCMKPVYMCDMPQKMLSYDVERLETGMPVGKGMLPKLRTKPAVCVGFDNTFGGMVEDYTYFSGTSTWMDSDGDIFGLMTYVVDKGCMGFDGHGKPVVQAGTSGFMLECRRPVTDEESEKMRWSLCNLEFLFPEKYRGFWN